MPIKDYFMMRIAISDEQFDELAEFACRIKDGDVPICEYLRCTEWFELLVAYGMANRERRLTNEP